MNHLGSRYTVYPLIYGPGNLKRHHIEKPFNHNIIYYNHVVRNLHCHSHTELTTVLLPLDVILNLGQGLCNPNLGFLI